MKVIWITATSLCACLSLFACSSEDAATSMERSSPPMAIPQVEDGPDRAITTRDLATLRDIDTLSVSPDGAQFVIRVRQADPDKNAYRLAWFLGSVNGEAPLSYLAEGGAPRLRETAAGRRVGVIGSELVRWSPDSTMVAFTSYDAGEVQIWVANASGNGSKQITHNAGDVREFGWRADSKALYFTVGEDRAINKARDEKGRREGFLLEEFQFLGQIHNGGQPERPWSAQTSVWSVNADGAGEHPADEAEQEDFEQVKNYAWFRNGTQGVDPSKLSAAFAPPTYSDNGRAAWLERDNEAENGLLPMLRLYASLNPDASAPIRCKHEECRSQIYAKLWWTEDSERVVYWSKTSDFSAVDEFYEWTPATDELRQLYRDTGDEFRECDYAGSKIICIRETLTRPDHVVSINVETGGLTDLADVNPEFRNIAFGRVERFEWRAPEDIYKVGYQQDMSGFILYPRDFDPTKKYPVYVAPYGEIGFRRGDVGDEHPMFVYAENGFVVLSLQFPVPVDGYRREPAPKMSDLYDPQKDFPYLTMYMDSTLAALDTVAARGFIDETRVGTGGLSHGSFVPLFMLLKKDRLSAVSIAGSGWTQFEYYASTKNGRKLNPVVEEWPEDIEFWKKLDMSYHTDKIEAPLMVNYADSEFFSDWRLPRAMEDGERAFEAYILPNENHSKWQPSHRLAIYNRNLDWFRFWLQDYEDPAPEKAEQYARWRELRKIQCGNPRSLRDYCEMEDNASTEDDAL